MVSIAAEMTLTEVLPARAVRIQIWVAVAVLALCAACGNRPAAPDLGVELAAGYRIELIATGLDGPTQMILGPDDKIWLAQLAGPEGSGMGQIIALDREDPAKREILMGGLSKPTGIAVIGEALWIAAGRDLLRANLDTEGKPAAPVTVFEDLPFNGRSNGTLTVTPGGRLIYETSGRRSGNIAAHGSASLWSLDPERSSQPQLVASGLKNAYAHTFDPLGRLWATDVADDPVNGGPPPDELNLITPGADYGWPACFGDQEPAVNYGGTAETCAATQPAAVVLPARSTPTSVVASPWEEDVLLVALWGPTEPSVIRVHFTEQDGTVTTDDISPFLTGLAHPQSLLLLPDGSLLVSEFESGTLYRIWPG